MCLNFEVDWLQRNCVGGRAALHCQTWCGDVVTPTIKLDQFHLRNNLVENMVSYVIFCVAPALLLVFFLLFYKSLLRIIECVQHANLHAHIFYFKCVSVRGFKPQGLWSVKRLNVKRRLCGDSHRKNEIVSTRPGARLPWTPRPTKSNKKSLIYWPHYKSFITITAYTTHWFG